MFDRNFFCRVAVLVATLLVLTAETALAGDVSWSGGVWHSSTPTSSDRWMITDEAITVTGDDFEIGSIDIRGTAQYAINVSVSFDLCGPISSDATGASFYGAAASRLALSGDATDLEFQIHGGRLTFSMPLSNDSIEGAIVKSGDGELILGEKVDMSGLSLDVREGTLYLNTERSAGKVTLYEGTTLAGYGTASRLIVGGKANVNASDTTKTLTLSNIDFAAGSALTANAFAAGSLIVDGIDASSAGTPTLVVEGRAATSKVFLEDFEKGDVSVRSGTLVVSHDRDYSGVSLDVAAGATLDMRIAVVDQASSKSTPVEFKKFTAEKGFTVALSADDELMVDKWYTFMKFSDKDGNTTDLTSADIAFVVDGEARSADLVYSDETNAYQVKLLQSEVPSIEELLEKVGANSKDLIEGWNIIWFDPELDGADAKANPTGGFRIKSGDVLTFETYFLAKDPATGDWVFDSSYDNQILSADMHGGLYSGSQKRDETWNGTDVPIATDAQTVQGSYAKFSFDEKGFATASGMRGAAEEYLKNEYHFVVYDVNKKLLADPANLSVYADRQGGGGSGSGVGCDAGTAAFGFFALLPLLPLIARRRK